MWFDQSELTGGDAWDQKIRGQIKACALFVPVISAGTQARREGYFRLEWKLAAQRTHTIADGTPFLLPVVIDDTRDADALVPEEFRAVQWTRLLGGETSPAFCERVRNLLGLESGTGVSPVKKHSEPHPARDVFHGRDAHATRTRWIWAPLAAGAVALGFFAVRPKFESSDSKPQTPPVLRSLGEGGNPKLPDLADAKSVAVLAFANLSDDKDNEYFSDGISEELLNVLAKVPGLKVSARTSAFYFKGKQVQIADIAKQLGVAYVVEGSVRKVGTRVRITAQLGGRGRHLRFA